MKNTEQIQNVITTIQNLTILRDGWIELDFEPKMNDFHGIDGEYIKDCKVGEINECGTVCCLLGAAPQMKGLEVEYSDFGSILGFGYMRYSRRILPYLQTYDNEYVGWDYVFGSDNPNSRQMGIERMTEMIAWLQFELLMIYLSE